MGGIAVSIAYGFLPQPVALAPAWVPCAAATLFCPEAHPTWIWGTPVGAGATDREDISCWILDIQTGLRPIGQRKGKTLYYFFLYDFLLDYLPLTCENFPTLWHKKNSHR